MPDSPQASAQPVTQSISPPAGQPVSRPAGQRRIGLTGGIASGKSTAANYLATVHQLPILDADRYAREAVQQHSLILARIAERYGPQVILPGKHLNRERLGQIVFNDSEERRWLESQIHPYVRQCFIDTIAALPDEPILILVIPLLFEAGLEDFVDEIWVVNCSPAQQLARLMARSNLSEAEAQTRIKAQMNLAQKCDRADLVLQNTTTPINLHRQIDQQMKRLRSGSRAGPTAIAASSPG